MPMPAAARRVIDVRLRSVGERLPLALFHAEEDQEHVHQLRVSTRRAGAAVRIFSGYLPHKEERAIAKALKNDGNYRWHYPNDLGGSDVFVRMDVSDKAGNVTHCDGIQPPSAPASTETVGRPKIKVLGGAPTHPSGN